MVAVSGACLMAPAPGGPRQRVVWVGRAAPGQANQDAPPLGHRQRDECGEPRPGSRGALLVGAPPVVSAAWARVTTRKAWASSASVTWRYQPSQRRAPYGGPP